MMRRITTSLFILFLFAASTFAQSSAVQKAAKSVFTLTTYKEDGSILSTTHGVYFVNGDEGISAFKPFIGAYRASIIDAGGNSSEVATIIGVNDMYDICRFRLSKGGATPLQACQTTATGSAWVVGYSAKKADILPLTIESSETFLDKYNYYIIKEESNEDIEGCPILTDAGELIGLVQQAGTSYAIHSTDSRYYSDLNSSGLSALDAVMQKTHIRINLPADHEQARLMLLTIDGAMDSINVVNTTNDYISLYPNDIDGYSAMASYEILHHNLPRASDVMETAIKKFKAKDEAYYEYARLMYSTITFAPDSTDYWTLDKAEQTVKKAISINDAPGYQHLLAQILFSKGQYSDALALFEALTTSEISNSEIYYEVAQCKSFLGESPEDVLAAVDRAVEACPEPLTRASGPYILARGMLLDEMGEERKALADYNLYDSLMYNRASDDFYYTRGKCEVKLRQFQQAINDFSHAVVINPREVTYLAELAALQLRVGQYDLALQACEMSFNITTDYSDVYIVQGLAYHQLGNDEDAFAAWEKAKELGDERAEEYMTKYSK